MRKENYMKKIILGVLIIGLALGVSFQGNTQADEDMLAKGKEMFTTFKCDACHGVESQGIVPKKKNDKSPDLSKVFMKGKAEWLSQYLMKEADLNGKKHPVKFSGKAEELASMVAWLEMVGLQEEPAPVQE